ncbi:MAG: phage tail sheath C-terminal domain-containing protein [Cyanobacteriota bacterium]|nr:phage tail sheath C-terminal domain-containing protein [Cyanobacteriota bacterium]
MTSSGLRKDRKTPGVYVTEFPAFPPTVAGVNTAVPCFIGYTAKAEDPVTKKSLIMEAVPIVSMAEYGATFGSGKSLVANYQVKLAAPPGSNPDFKAMSGQLQGDKITLDSLLACNVALQSGDDKSSHYNLYLSMQMFYANGGGFCYVISVGDYSQDKSKQALLDGLNQARAIHDVTMIVVPDACLLKDDDYGAVVAAMLDQAGDLRNRVAIVDLPSATQITDPQTLKAKTISFYQKISSAQDAFSYGAAYGPAVQSTFFSADDLDYQVLGDNPLGSAKPVCNLPMNHLLTSQAVALYLSDRDKLNDVLDKIATAYPIDEAQATALDATKLTQVCNADGRAVLRKQEGDTIFADALAALKCLATVPIPMTATAADGGGGAGAGAGSGASPAEQKPADDQKQAEPVDQQAAANAGAGAKPAQGAGEPATGLCAIRSKGGGTSTPISPANLDKYLNNATPFLQQVEQVVANRINVLPPSAILAGIWTKSDGINGVWNAPANMALNMVLGPLVRLNDQEQGDYNMPPNGQSISILRAQPGRGTVVWGARTLDGNSNDTRYIQVRRTLIYIEQSIKQSLQSFVFAPNDAKTWTTVTSMISNFLTTLWQAGGLMGAKPDEAFSVACGVPTTMTGLDVLNGYMIVNVSLQLIRPAEFIELTFTQRMQGV